MMVSSVCRLLAVVACLVCFLKLEAQPVVNQSLKKETRPFKILTSGKEITIKSSRNILQVMLWSTSGHRVVEQREINADFYTFTIPLNEKIFFLMVGLDGGKIYTEKIGVR